MNPAKPWIEPEDTNMVRPDFQAIAKAAAAHAVPEVEQRAREEEVDNYKREMRLSESGIKGAITDEDIEWVVKDTLPLHTGALATMQLWMNERSSAAKRQRSIFALLGATGRGKTVAGAWLLARHGGQYVTAESLRRLYVSTHYREAARLEKLLKAKCVMVDDAGGELDSHTAQAAMFEVVNQRAGHAAFLTVITSNLSTSEFVERYDIRTVRRIEHQGALVEVEGDDLRRRS
jgi:DNA replication protein DnaC